MRRERSTTHPAARSPRRQRRIHEEVKNKLPELAGCPRCGASYRNGRWTWKPAPVGSYEEICPACERIEANYPAGELHVRGKFAAERRDEILRSLRNIEQRERSEHPQKRIMEIVDVDSGFVVTVTDAKLVRTFGRSLKKSYGGQLQHPLTTSDVENLVRVDWTRD